MASSSERLRELLEHAVRAGQPAAALRAMSALREELDAFERLQVARALDAGGSFGDVARAIGISRQAAHRRYRDLVGVELPDEEAGPQQRRLVVTSEARAAVTLAREEATAMGAAAVGSEHLLLGIMRCRAPVTSAVLETKGVTLADARRCAQPTLVEGGADGARAGRGAAGGGAARHLRLRARRLRPRAARGDQARRRLRRRRPPAAGLARGSQRRRLPDAVRARARPRAGARRRRVLSGLRNF